MKNKMFNIAKEKDDGKFAKLGMKEYVATWFDIDINAPAVLQIVDTYLEYVDTISFDTWINGLCYETKPIILKRDDLEASYKDLLYVSDNLEVIADLFMYLYDEKFYVDEISDCIWSTSYAGFDRGRKKLDFISIAMEYERLYTLASIEILCWHDVYTLIDCLNEYGYNMKDYDVISGNDVYETAYNIQERLEEVFLL